MEKLTRYCDLCQCIVAVYEPPYIDAEPDWMLTKTHWLSNDETYAVCYECYAPVRRIEAKMGDRFIEMIETMDAMMGTGAE